MKLLINESKLKYTLSEGLNYHLKNNITIQDSIFRLGSKAWCNMINEARVLHEKGILSLDEDEKFIVDSDAGKYGLYEGEEVPLDAPFPLDDKGNYAVFCLNENGETTKVVFSESDSKLINEIDFIKDVESKYPISISFKYLISDEPAIYIQSIIVDKEKRKEGVGSKAMQDIIDWADDKGVIITLTPENTFGTPVSVLQKFYKKFGFINNKGRNKDYRFIGGMIRYPKK